jgi:hypothetical protein
MHRFILMIFLKIVLYFLLFLTFLLKMLLPFLSPLYLLFKVHRVNLLASLVVSLLLLL